MKAFSIISLTVFILAASHPILSAEKMHAPLETTHFNGAEDWPLYTPGQLKIDNEKLESLRVAYDAIFATPAGPLKLGSYIDVHDVMFNGIPAHWMQWMFTSEEEGTGNVANLDLLIMDRKTGALRYRMLPSGGASKWGGPYSFIGASDIEIKRLLVSDADGLKVEEMPVGSSVFDFGGLPFVLPFMNMETGQGIRLTAYQHSGEDGVQVLNVKAIGPTQITDTSGRAHDVFEIQTMAPSRSNRVSFYVSDKAPYFYGWDYRKIEDGTSLFKMIYRGYVSTKIER